MEEFTTITMPDIPERCKKCPRLAVLNEMADKALERREQTLAVMMSKTLSEQIREAADDSEAADAMLRINGQYTVEVLERIDEELEGVKELASRALAACSDGPLKMRASKTGRTYTATVCTSGVVSTGEALIDNVGMLITEP
jgi:hypothetical protein